MVKIKKKDKKRQKKPNTGKRNENTTITHQNTHTHTHTHTYTHHKTKINKENSTNNNNNKTWDCENVSLVSVTNESKESTVMMRYLQASVCAPFHKAEALVHRTRETGSPDRATPEQMTAAPSGSVLYAAVTTEREKVTATMATPGEMTAAPSGSVLYAAVIKKREKVKTSMATPGEMTAAPSGSVLYAAVTTEREKVKATMVRVYHNRCMTVRLQASIWRRTNTAQDNDLSDPFLLKGTECLRSIIWHQWLISIHFHCKNITIFSFCAWI